MVRDYSRKLFGAAIRYGREQVTNAAWVHAKGMPNAAGGLGDAVRPQRVQSRALVGDQGAKPPEASRFYTLVMPEMALKIA